LILAYLVDPQVKKAEILVKYAKGDKTLKTRVENIISETPVPVKKIPKLQAGPFQTENEAVIGIINGGKKIVETALVGSVFGNVSSFFNEKVFISTSGSHLDNLENSIAVTDINGNILNGLNPSSELPSHLRIYRETTAKCILHGHPFFTVVMSMISGIGKTLFGIPIVGGETGGGEKGIVHTVPDQLKKLNIVVVYGHGVFAVDAFDFNNPLNAMLKLEKLSRKRYINKYFIRK
jgi:ribulose-5-phosphate 4-epimerase/fuculose-1-phosphate aldolase